jgi:ATP-dependent DNA helicase RecG
MTDKQLNLFELDDESLIYHLLDDEFLPQEYYEIEYKSGRNGFPVELWKTYSAFANTNTGIIVIGIREKKGQLIIEGLNEEQITKYKKQFWDECNNQNSISRNLLNNNDIKVVTIKEKSLLVLRVPFASRTDRPVYLTRNPFGNTYKRNHEGDYRCTEDEVKRMLADSSAELKRDSRILENFTVNDFDTATVKQFRQLFISSKPNHPWHALEDIDLFKKIGAYRVDRKTKEEGITLAGLLMFGKEESIKDQDQLPDFFPDFRERLSTEPKIRWTDRICPDGTWENNLLQFYLKVWPKLTSTLPKPFLLNKDERVDETPTHVALREAFINALVHADYSQGGSIIIELDTEKFVFSNPGTLLLSIHQYYAGGISECRNPALQQMFMLIGRAEKAGSGVDKIMSGWQESHWRRPFLEIEHQPDRIKLTLPMFSVIPDAVLNELNFIFDDVSHLSADELTALSFCQIEGSISNQRLQYVLNIHSSDITTLLKKLCTDKYLESDNNGRWTIYKLKQKVATSSEKVVTSTSKVDTSNEVSTFFENTDNQYFLGKKVDTSGEKVDTSGEKVDTSGGKVDTSGEKVDTSGEKVATRTKLNREQLEAEIMKICQNNYIKMEEVASILGKSVDYLKNKIFPLMMKSGKLEKRFPFTHNHPEQGYKTSEEYDK